jgi:integrase/recombinase XerD
MTQLTPGKRSRKRKQSALDLASLLPSWELALRHERKSRETIKSYTTGMYQFLDWCEANGHNPGLDKHLVRSWVNDLITVSAVSPATAVARQLGVRRFSAWCEEEGEIDDDPLLGLRSPKIDKKVTKGLPEDQLKNLIKACAGKDFLDRRDEAMLRLMAETGIRAGELLALTLDDVDLLRGQVTIRRGKGGKGRVSPITESTARSIDRYLRVRRAHIRAESSAALWLGDRGKLLGYFGLRDALQRRAVMAGIENFHPHLMRHTFATRWKAAGGSDDGLMSVAGWSSRDMIDRYAGAAAAERAATEARRLGLGEI